MIKLFFVDKNEAYSLTRYVFADTPLEAINYLYPDNLYVEQNKDVYRVEYMQWSYVYLRVTEVAIVKGLVI